MSRTAVVTGAGSGVGRAVALGLLAAGYRVALAGRRRPELEATAAAAGGEALVVPTDVSDETAVANLFGAAGERFGRVDLLFNNAGRGAPAVPIDELPVETWRAVVDVNLTGAFLCARRALPGMREQRYGRIVAIGSSAGKSGGAKSVAAYAASKAGIMAMAKSIANEFARDGITANALAPSLIDTPMIANQRELVDRIPVGRFGKPEEVAALVCFLASEDAGYITGEVTDINGGFLID